MSLELPRISSSDLSLQDLPVGKTSLGNACGCEVDIGPACKAVFQVPDRFAVSNEHQGVHGEK